jgi:hypothetical protein
VKTEPPDDRLGRLFREGRLADEASAPDFHRLLARTPRRRGARPRPRGFRLALAAAALAALVAALVWIARPSRSVPTPVPATTDIAAWTSPTDALLQTSGSELWSTLPVLVTSDLPAESPRSPQRTKGASR